ncbi:MAG: hypothetical protein Greene07144_92, partial [Parcubacteria group bacterium Greene0714_4]
TNRVKNGQKNGKMGTVEKWGQAQFFLQLANII